MRAPDRSAEAQLARQQAAWSKLWAALLAPNADAADQQAGAADAPEPPAEERQP